MMTSPSLSNRAPSTAAGGQCPSWTAWHLFACPPEHRRARLRVQREARRSRTGATASSRPCCLPFANTPAVPVNRQVLLFTGPEVAHHRKNCHALGAQDAHPGKVCGVGQVKPQGATIGQFLNHGRQHQDLLVQPCHQVDDMETLEVFPCLSAFWLRRAKPD